MAKGQRSNREHKKPKQLKAKPTAAGSSFSLMPPTSGSYSPGKKK
jgi:hypothetical protein